MKKDITKRHMVQYDIDRSWAKLVMLVLITTALVWGFFVCIDNAQAINTDLENRELLASFGTQYTIELSKSLVYNNVGAGFFLIASVTMTCVCMIKFFNTIDKYDDL